MSASCGRWSRPAWWHAWPLARSASATPRTTSTVASAPRYAAAASRHAPTCSRRSAERTHLSRVAALASFASSPCRDGLGCGLRQRRGEEALHRVEWLGALVCSAQDEGALESCEQYGGIVLCS